MDSTELRTWRERLGLTQPQAAELLEMPIGTYRGWEQGRFSIPGVVEVACRLIEARNWQISKEKAPLPTPHQ